MSETQMEENIMYVEPGAVGFIVPGVFFTFVGFWWALNVFWLFSQTRHRPQYFLSSRSYNCHICRTRQCNPTLYSLEGLVKLAAAIFGVTYVMVTSFQDGELRSIANIQIATVYMLFGLSGIVDILNSRCCNVNLNQCLPRHTDYALMSAAFAIEGLAIEGHLLADEHFLLTYQYIHTLLMYISYACAASFILEAAKNSVPLIALVRCFCVTLHGTWLITSGLIVYSNVLIETEEVPEAFSWTGVYFSWNFIGIIVAFLILAVCLHVCNLEANDANTSTIEHQMLPCDDLERSTSVSTTIIDHERIATVNEHDGAN